jgi:hypothetical protein
MLAVLAGILVLADRGLALLAGNLVADTVADGEHLKEKPSVGFGGFPFITQAFGGEFDQVDVTVRDFRPGGADSVRIDRIDVHLRKVKVGLGKVVSGKVDVVPVAAGQAMVRIRYGDLDDYLSRRPGDLEVHPEGGELLVKGSVSVPGGGTVPVEGTGEVVVSGREVVVTTRSVHALGVNVPAAVLSAAGKRLSFRIPLKDLPLCITLGGFTVGEDSLDLVASAQRFVIRPTSSTGATCD